MGCVVALAVGVGACSESEASGITIDPPELTLETSEALVITMFDCSPDVAAEYAQSFGGESADILPEENECLGTRIAGDTTYRKFVARTFVDPAAVFGREEALVLATAMSQCVDFVRTAGVNATPDQLACMRSAFQSDLQFIDLLSRRMIPGSEPSEEETNAYFTGVGERCANA